MLSPKLNFVGQFNPRQLAGLSLWLDGADSSTMFQNLGGTIPVTGAAQPVLRWDDKSGNGRNARATRPLGRIGGTYPRGSGYTSAPTVTIVRDPNDSTGVGATATATVSGGQVTAVTFTNRGTFYQLDALVQFSGGGSTLDDVTATATVGPTRHMTPPGVMFNNGSLSVQRGPYMEIPATTIPQSYTVFSVYTRIQSADASLPSLSLSTGFSTPSEAAPQGSRYASFWGQGAFENQLFSLSTAIQTQFTTHMPQRGFHDEVTIVKTVRTAGTSVLMQVNDMPASTVTTGAGVTNPSSGVWTSVGSDVNLQGAPAAQVLRAHRGPMHEIIVYDRALTPQEQATVTEYLREKWSVIFGSRFNLDWTVTGASAWPGYRYSIANTISTTTVVVGNPTTPNGTYPGINAFIGGVLLPDGRVFCVPRTTTTARIYDPVANEAITPAGTYPGNNAFAGGVLLRDGRVFCVPLTSTTARIYDPVSNTLTTPAGTYPGNNAFTGGVLLPDGRVFCVPRNSTTARIYDPVSNTLTTPPGTYPGSESFYGGVLLPDGRVFCVPRSSTTARIYDPVSNTLTTPSGTYPGNSAFYGGVLLPDGRVYCVPHLSTTARIYNPASNTLTTPAGTYGSSYGVLLPDGRVFCVPHEGTVTRIYDPVSDTLISAAGTYPGPFAFAGGVLLLDGRVFFVPHSSTTARLWGGGGGFNNNVSLSAYYNKL